MTPELLCIGCTIKEAIAKLQAMLGGKFFSIRMALTFPQHSAVETDWQVYDGITQSIHRAPTLAAAVNATLLAICDHAAEQQSNSPPS